MMASASLPVTPPHQIQFPTPSSPLSIIRPSVIVNSVHDDNCKMECGATSQLLNGKITNCPNNQLLNDHNYAALPPTSTAAYFGIKPICQKITSQCGASTNSSVSACCSSHSSTSTSTSTNCLGILRTTLTSPSPTTTKYQLTLQLNVLRCEIERLNENCVKQQSQLEKLREDNSLKTVQLSEHLERIYVQENRLEEKQNRLDEEIIEKTELQDKFSRFKESATKLSLGVILLIGELKREYGGESLVKVKRNGIINGKKEEDGYTEDNYKRKVVNELDKISELVRDKLRAWVLVDQFIEEEEVRMMRESLSRNRKRGEEEEEDGEGKEVQVVVQEVEVVEEEKENLSVVSGGDEDEGGNDDKWGPEEENKEEMEVLDEEERTSVGNGEAVDESEYENEGDLKEVSELSSQQSHSEQEEEDEEQAVSKVQKEPVDFFRCSMCPSLSMKFGEMAMMKMHLKEVHQNKQWRNARVCKRCRLVFVGLGPLQKHRSSEHSKSKATSKKKKSAVVPEEALHGQGRSKLKINKTSLEIPDSPRSTPPPPSVKMPAGPEPVASGYQHPYLHSNLKPVKIVVSDIMLGGELKKKKDKTSEEKTKERRTQRSSSKSPSTSRISTPSPPPPVLKKMTKSVRRIGSNNSLASSTLSTEISYDDFSKPPVLDLEVECDLSPVKVEEREEPPEPQRQSSPVVPEVQASIPPPSPPPSSSSLHPPPMKQEENNVLISDVGHGTDILRRHLGVYCVCGKQFPRQSRLDLHIRLKTKPIHSATRRRSDSTSAIKVRRIRVAREKHGREKLVVREKPVKKEIPCTSANANSFSTRTRRSSIIAAGANSNAATVKIEVEDPVPSTSALASSSASIPTTEKVTTVIAKPKMKKKKITHGLHPSNPLHCKCGFKAPLINFVKRHIKFHKPDRKFSCQICHRIFVSVRYLSHHYKTFHKVSQTTELVTARGQVGKLMNCYVKIGKLDADVNGHGPAQKNESSDKTEDDDMSPRQLPWRPIFKKKLKKLRFTKRKERFICPWCQRHFPFYRKLARHLALNMHTGCDAGSDTGAGTSGGGGGGAMKKMLFGCKPCEKIFYNQVEFLRHKAVFHRCSNSLTKFITVQKEINASIAAAAAADLSSSDGIKTRRALRMSSKSSSFSLSSSSKAKCVASGSTSSAQAARSRLGQNLHSTTKSARKRSFVSKTQRRVSLSSSPSRNSKCLCSASDTTSPCNSGAGGSGSKSKKRKGKKNFKCFKCQRVFTCPAYLRMHMGEKHNITCVIPKPCQRCGKVFPTASQLKKHTEVAHNKLKKPVKRQLRQETPSPRKEGAARSPPGSPVGPHRRMAGGGSRFKCVCGSLFSHKKLLFQHIQEKNQAKGKFFSCNLCPKQYTGSVHLKIHMFRTHNIRSVTSKSKKSNEFRCQFCGKIFETQRKRIWHESRSHGMKKKVK